MTEVELRKSVVNIMRSWLGWSEANGKFRAIIDLYNTQNPLPRGYKLQYDDEWCAATVTAAGIQAGLEDIIFGECSCSRMVALYQKAGSLMEDDAYKPQIGDIVMYRWDDGINYASTDNTSSPNHVGMVAEVNGRVLTIIEGNKGQKVATRSLFVNGRYIRGYCLPDYKSKSEEDDDMSYEQFDQYMNRYLTARNAKTADDWAKPYIQDAIDAGAMTDVGGTIQSPQGFVTRQEMAVVAAALSKK